MSRRIAGLAAGAVVLALPLAGLAGAKGAPKAAPAPKDVFAVRTNLALVGGEDPSLAGVAPAFAWVGTGPVVTRVKIEEMDAARFPASVRTPAGTVAPCVATLAFGPTSQVVPVQANGATTFALMNLAPNAAVGTPASADVVCDWIDRKGVAQHHETHWAGSL